MFSNKLTDKIMELNVENERIIALELDFGQKICFINVYKGMPTNKDSEYNYRECLDVLHDIICRFESTHKIVLCGDLICANCLQRLSADNTRRQRVK